MGMHTSMWKRFGMVLMIVVLLAAAVMPAAEPPVRAGRAGATAADGGPLLLSSGADEIVFVVPVPWQQLEVVPVHAGGTEYARLSLPGWDWTAEPGAPRLPSRFVSLGIPFGVEVTVEVETGQGRSVALPAPVAPVPTKRAEWRGDGIDAAEPGFPSLVEDWLPSPAWYQAPGQYPGAAARVVADGVVRGQRVLGVAVYPVQYDPGRQAATVYLELVVHVRLGSALSAQAADPGADGSSAFEALFADNLLNYHSARQWRRAPAADRGPEAAPWTPPNPGYRVLVKEEGIYRLTYTDLGNAGLPVDDLDPRTFRLYNLGAEVAIWVEGEADGSFDDQDSVLLYGKALADKYTWYNIYWLAYGGAPGKRMAARDGTPGAAAVAPWFADTLHMENNLFYLRNVPGAEALERFLWRVLSPSAPSWSYSVTLPAPHLGGYSPALQASLFGLAFLPGDPPPRVQIKVNNVLVDDHTWTAGTVYLSNVSLPENLLVAGTNTLTLVNANAKGGIYVDWAELAFENTFTAADNLLKFGYDTLGLWQYQIGGFTLSDVAVYDIADPAAVKRITGASVVPSGPGYQVSFEDEVMAATSYWVTSSSRYRQPYGIALDVPSDLGSAANAADYIAIAPADFAAQAAALVAYRASKGMRSVWVDVQDVYDQFGYGITGPGAIHDFLDYAYHHWQAPAPAYALLLGDGHYDPKNYQGYGRASYVPPYLAPVDPWIVETAADNRFVTVDGDDVFPDLIIGRLPANSAAEAQVMVDKAMNYELAPAGDWKTRVAFVADNADSAGDFAAISDALIACCLGAGYTAHRVYYLVTHPTLAEARAAIIGGINDGRYIVNYDGHGNANLWADPTLFSAGDIASLANGGMLPIMLPMTCLEGYFIYPPADSQSLGESIVRASGKGAVASWSPTGLGVSTGHDHLDRGFFDAVFKYSHPTLGGATLDGKFRLWQTNQNLDLIDTYVLFGDPALWIALSPTSVTLLSFTAEPAENSVLLQWETATEVDNLGFNLHRAERKDGPRTQVNAELIPSQVPPGSPGGAAYEFVDSAPGPRNYYWLEAVDVYGARTLFGPVQATLGRVYLPLLRR
jgi:hypothetical protein